MKKSLFWMLFAFPAAALFAQFPPPAEKPTAYLDVKLSAGENKSSHSYHGDINKVGDSTRQNVRSMAISITAGTLMHSPLDARIEWFFVAKDLAKKNDFIFDHGTKDVTFKGGLVEQFDAVSKDIESTVTNETIYGMSELTPKLTGAKPDGWIVRITAGGAVLDMRASSSALEDAANDPDQLQKLQDVKGPK